MHANKEPVDSVDSVDSVNQSVDSESLSNSTFESNVSSERRQSWRIDNYSPGFPPRTFPKLVSSKRVKTTAAVPFSPPSVSTDSLRVFKNSLDIKLVEMRNQ